MNSRIGLGHPARSKTTMVVSLSGMTPVGGGASGSNNSPAAGGSPVSGGAAGNLLLSGVTKSRTMDLSHHLGSSPSSLAAAAACGGSLSSPLRGGGSSPRSLTPRSREGCTRQRSWDVGGSKAPTSSSRNQGAAWGVASHEGQANVFEDNRSGGGRGAGEKRDSCDVRGSLPPLSPRSSREHAERERERERNRRHERDHGSNSRGGGGDRHSSPRTGPGRGDSDRDGGRGEEQKSPSSPRAYGPRSNEDSGAGGEGVAEFMPAVSLFRSPTSGGGAAGIGSHAARYVRPSSPKRSVTFPPGKVDVGGSECGGGDPGRETGGQDSCDDDDDDDSGDGGRGREQHRLPSPRGCLPRERGKDTGQREGGGSDGREDREKAPFLSASPRGERGEGRSLSQSSPSIRHVSCAHVAQYSREQSRRGGFVAGACLHENYHPHRRVQLKITSICLALCIGPCICTLTSP